MELSDVHVGYLTLREKHGVLTVPDLGDSLCELYIGGGVGAVQVGIYSGVDTVIDCLVSVPHRYRCDYDTPAEQ